MLNTTVSWEFPQLNYARGRGKRGTYRLFMQRPGVWRVFLNDEPVTEPKQTLEAAKQWVQEYDNGGIC